MKKIIVFITFALLTVSTTTLAENEPDAVYHKIIKEYTLYADGSYDLHCFKQLELKSLFAFNRLFGETFVVYNPAYQDLQINQAYTVMKDGTKVKTPDNAFNEVLPRQAHHFPAYNHLREMVITHTALEPGATIFLDYTLSTQAGMQEGFATAEPIRRNMPVKEIEIRVHVPRNMDFNHKLTGLRLTPEMYTKGNQVTYLWKFYNQPAIPHEENMASDATPELFLHQGQDAVKSQLFVDDIVYDLPKTLSNWVATQKKQYPSKVALLFRLHDYVRNQPGYSDLEIAQTGGKVRTLREVFQSNIATKMEKSLLLTAMVIEAGIHAEPVVVYQKNVIPLLKNNQLKVKIDLKDEVPILLDVNKPFAYNQWFRYAGQLATPVVSGKTNQVIQIYEADNIIKFKGDLRITKTINLGTASLYLQHYPNHLKALFDDSTAKKIIYPIKPNTVERTKSSIVSTSYSITFKDTTNLLSKIQSRYRFQIPEIKSAVSEWKPLLFDERQTIYTLPYPIQEDYELEVELEGWQCVNQEINLKNKTDWGYASLKIRNKGNSVKINRSINIEKKTFNQKEYSELKEMINIYKNYNGKTLILKN